jgi:serine/threonine-protein kinase RsbW
MGRRNLAGTEDDDDPQALTLRLPTAAGPEEGVARLLDRLEAYAEATGLGPRTAHRLALVCEELVANVLTHGAAGPAGASFVALTVRRPAAAGGALHVAVEDDGPAFDPLAGAPGADTTSALEEREIGGLGLHLIRTMARAPRYERLAARNRVELLIDPAG